MVSPSVPRRCWSRRYAFLAVTTALRPVLLLFALADGSAAASVARSGGPHQDARHPGHARVALIRSDGVHAGFAQRSRGATSFVLEEEDNGTATDGANATNSTVKPANVPIPIFAGVFLLQVACAIIPFAVVRKRLGAIEKELAAGAEGAPNDGEPAPPGGEPPPQEGDAAKLGEADAPAAEGKS
eukprot:TRINITY_DN46075_c0_g1_i1.p1 TRINITY_DN46075_c0_g1~~TRINITY_DN46075_c0_g1_i1.p1  ORF type:complete len:197 (+),score=24.93 TRINITY_DN46075_c0_g1_i1:39-593(+)